MRQELETTIAFYNEQYAKSTVQLNMQKLYDRFEKYLPKGAFVLDAGCGSGRDSKHFIERGYTVSAFDASETMCECASKLIGQDVRKLTFQKMDYQNCFDGIWACASLLHVPEDEIELVLMKVFAALKPGGVLYASWKYGNETRFELHSGRLFCDMNENNIDQYLSKNEEIQIEEIWKTNDVRENAKTQIWLNIIVRKLAC